MLKYTRVLDGTTGNMYYVSNVKLMNDEGYDTTPNGENHFEVDLEPVDMDGTPRYNVPVFVKNNGYVVEISKDLDNFENAKSPVQMVDAFIIHDTLVVLDLPNPTTEI